MSSLSEARKGEIALLVLKHKMRDEGVKITPHYLRSIGNVAKSTGIPKDELTMFVESLTRELVDEAF